MLWQHVPMFQRCSNHPILPPASLIACTVSSCFPCIPLDCRTWTSTHWAFNFANEQVEDLTPPSKTDQNRTGNRLCFLFTVTPSRILQRGSWDSAFQKKCQNSLLSTAPYEHVPAGVTLDDTPWECSSESKPATSCNASFRELLSYLRRNSPWHPNCSQNAGRLHRSGHSTIATIGTVVVRCHGFAAVCLGCAWMIDAWYCCWYTLIKKTLYTGYSTSTHDIPQYGWVIRCN